jgi:hypothetical protein
MGQKYERLFERVYAALTADEPHCTGTREELINTVTIAIQTRAREMNVLLTYPVCYELAIAAQGVMDSECVDKFFDAWDTLRTA